MASELLDIVEDIELWGDPEIVKLSGYINETRKNFFLTVELKTHYFRSPISFTMKRDTRNDFNFNYVSHEQHVQGIITEMVDGVERNTGVISLNASLDTNTKKIEVIVDPNRIVYYEKPEPEPEPEPEKTLMIPNYNVINAYVDTSYIPFGSGGVIVSSFSSDGGNKQEIAIDDTLRITTNDGYQFDLDNLEDYYFDVQFQPYNYSLRLSYDSSKPFIRVNLSEFRPATGISTFSWLENNTSYPLYKSVPTDNTMFYTYSVGDTKHLIILLGGLRENDLLFFTFTKSKSGNDDIAFTMNGEKWVSSDLFSAKFYDPVADERVELSFLDNLNFVAVPSTDTPIEDTSKYLFNTYYISSSDLSMLRENSGLVSDVIINTYSYPVNFAEDDLVDVDFSVANITQNIPAKRFLFNNTEVEIFKFTIPDVPDVSDIRVRIPFNNDVTLHYEDVRGKTITGRFSYEVLTNSTTLFINDGVSDIYKNLVGVGVVVPYKPTGRFEGGNDPTTRLAVDEPKLFIKGVGKTIKGNYIQGTIGKVVEDMLNSERDKLNTLLENGVFFND